MVNPRKEIESRMTQTMFSSIKESYYKSFNNKSRAAEFIQLASVAVKAGFANEELSKQIGIKRINDAQFAQIKHHADYGADPGESVNYGARSQRGRQHNEESLVMFISHLLETSTMSASSKKKDVGTKDVDALGSLQCHAKFMFRLCHENLPSPLVRIYLPYVTTVVGNLSS